MRKKEEINLDANEHPNLQRREPTQLLWNDTKHIHPSNTTFIT